MTPQPTRIPSSLAQHAAASQDLEGLRGQLQALIQRQRRLLLARAAAQLVAALILTTVVAAVVVSGGMSRDSGLLVVAVGGLLAASLALLHPLLRRWSPAGDLLVQARRLEVLQPLLRSRLVTTVDRALLPPAPRPPGVQPLPLSGALLARAAARARVLAAPIPSARVHSARPAWRALGGACLAVGLAVLSAWILPVGPVDALRALATGNVAAARLADGVELSDDAALVGDINLRYVFPEYTGLEPVDVPISDGTIHAPPGTRVQITARTAQAFDGVAIQVDQLSPVDAVLDDRRDVSASLTVTGAGSWRFILFDGDQVMRSPDYRIVVEADAQPVVTASAKGDQVAVDAPLEIAWQADDDFGIETVTLEVEQDGVVREVQLRRPLDPQRRIEGEVTTSPRKLGLKPGDEVTLRVVALDNDQLTGGQRGASADLSVRIMGPQELGRDQTRYYQSLRDAMVLVLADFLVESDELPVANDSLAMQRWVGTARLRFDPVRQIFDRQWGDDEPNTPDADMTRQVIDDAAVLFRFTLTTFDPSAARRVTLSDLDTFGQLHDAEIESLEVAIGLLDALLQRNALQDVAQAARAVQEQARQFADMAQDAEAGEILARLDQLERLMAAVAKASARLSEGQLREFLNSRLASSRALIDEIREAIAQGRLDDARAMLDALAQQLQQLSEGIEDQLQAGQQDEDQLGDKVKDTLAALKQLQTDQGALAEQLQQALQQEGGQFQEQINAWTRLDELSDEAMAQAAAALDAAGDGRGWRVENIRRLENQDEVVGGLRDAVRARDVMGARERVENADFRQRQAAVAMSREGKRSRLASDDVPDGLRVATDQVRAVGLSLEEISRILEQLQQDQGQTSPELAQKARELSSQQQELSQQEQRLQRDVQGIERQLPTGQGQATQAMERAAQAMESAGEALKSGRPSPGQGHMQDAANQVGAAADELEHQQQQLQQLQQMQQQMRGQDGGQAGRKDSDGEVSRPRMEIPAPENFRTPEQYRRALLQGMEADVPEEYQALKKQYYEELVRQ